MKKSISLMLPALAGLILAIAIPCFAADDNPPACPMQQNKMRAWHHPDDMQGMKRHPGSGPARMACQDISEEDRKKIDTAVKAFHKDTRDLHQQILSKKLALKSELVKTEPSPKLAMALQKELSDLKAQLAEKRLSHLLDIKKINPYAGKNFWDDCSGKGRGCGNCR